MKVIPYNKAFIPQDTLYYVSDALNRQTSGDGFYTKKVQQFIEETFNTKKALLTTSCSMALDMAGILLNLQPGDEVILPSYTFVSTANSIVSRGATPVFAEISNDTLNINPQDIKNKITKKTKAIFVVHYAGISCDMDEILCIARQNNIMIVEDAAQGVNAKYKDRFLGTIGDIGCYSFHETKNYSCGEGGAILINSNSELIERAEIIREKGTNRSKFFRGEIDKYTWVDIGSSFLPSDILAAMLYAQFEKLEEINNKRKQLFEIYYDSLKLLQDDGILRLPVIPRNYECNYHMFYILLNSENERNQLLEKLKEKGIQAVFHYIPLHISPMGKKFGYKAGDFPITESISGRLLRLPLYFDLDLNDQKYIVNEIKKHFGYLKGEKIG